jgi:hypothetical protein
VSSRTVYIVQRVETYEIKAADPDEAVQLSEVYAPATTEVFVELTPAQRHADDEETILH